MQAQWDCLRAENSAIYNIKANNNTHSDWAVKWLSLISIRSEQVSKICSIVKSSSHLMHIGGSSPFNKKEWVMKEWPMCHQAIRASSFPFHWTEQGCRWTGQERRRLLHTTRKGGGRGRRIAGQQSRNGHGRNAGGIRRNWGRRQWSLNVPVIELKRCRLWCHAGANVPVDSSSTSHNSSHFSRHVF